MTEKSLYTLEESFLQDLSNSGKSANTIKNYKTDLVTFKKFLQKETIPQNISVFNLNQIKEYATHLGEIYSSDNSIRRKMQTLRIFADYLVANELINNNPVKGIPTNPKFLDIPKPTDICEIKKLWTYLEEQKINDKNELEKLKILRNQLIIIVIFGCGLKVSELSKLKINSIQRGSSPRIIINPPKIDPYSVPAPEIINNILTEYIPLLEKMKTRFNLTFNHLLFNANQHAILSGGISARGLEKIMKYFREKLKIDILTPKSIRQACIFKWLYLKHDDSLIKEWLGVAPSYELKQFKNYLDSTICYDQDFFIMLGL